MQQQQQQLTFLSPSLTHGLLGDMSVAQRHDATQLLLSNLLNSNGVNNMNAVGGLFRLPIQQQQQQQQQAAILPNQLLEALQSSALNNSRTAPVPPSTSRPSLVSPQQLLMLQQLLKQQSDRGPLGSTQDATDKHAVLGGAVSASGKALNLAPESGAHGVLPHAVLTLHPDQGKQSHTS
jgi:hypothetical protein